MARQAAERLFQMKKTQIQMMEDRGYVIDEDEKTIFDWSLDDFITAYKELAIAENKDFRESLNRYYFNKEGETECFVFYARPDKDDSKLLGVNVVRKFVEEIDTTVPKTALFITSLEVSPPGKSSIGEILVTRTQIFYDRELMFNPTKHVWNPVFELVENQANFLRENRVQKVTQLPCIFVTDPVVKYYGFRPGSIVRIYRKNQLEGLVRTEIDYRLIVDK